MGMMEDAKYDIRKLGADLEQGHLQAVELAGAGFGAAAQSSRSVSAAEYHSLLAMEAARKMRRTRQKLKTGQQVCHHLKMMLAEPTPRRAAAPAPDSQFDLGF